MAHDVVDNNPKKEILFALIGIVTFLSIVLLIGISAFLRPAGDHVDVQALNKTVEATTAPEASAPATTDTAKTETATTEQPAEATTNTATADNAKPAEEAKPAN